MRILITGANGFMGKNMLAALRQESAVEVAEVIRSTSAEELLAALAEVDAVVHLAGVNRPQDPAEFEAGNVAFTAQLCSALREQGRPVPLVFASSTQAELDNPYGRSKLAAEAHVLEYSAALGAPVRVYRLPGVFGKWCRPNYNSVVATFCHNVIHGRPLTIHDPSAALRLVYIDDVVAELRRAVCEPRPGAEFGQVTPVYDTTVGQLAAQLEAFARGRNTLASERVGSGLTRALYATYVSYFEPAHFSYGVPKHGDQRGLFVEMLKTPDSGQFSFFTAHPGVTRGGHYHHTKTEKFLVVRGRARFKFRQILTDEAFELVTHGDEPTIVETVPGWAHDITNVGEDEMIVLLWANEVFDPERPDTFSCKVSV